MGGAQPVLGGAEQAAIRCRLASLGQNVDGDDMTDTTASRFCNNKSYDRGRGLSLLRRSYEPAVSVPGGLRDQGKRAGPLQIGGEFQTAV